MVGDRCGNSTGPCCFSGSERGLLRRVPAAPSSSSARRAGGPGVLLRGTAAVAAASARAAAVAATAAAPAAAPAAAEAAASTTAARGLGDLRGGVAERRADLVDLHLDHGALLALLGLVGPAAQPAADE